MKPESPFFHFGKNFFPIEEKPESYFIWFIGSYLTFINKWYGGLKMSTKPTNENNFMQKDYRTGKPLTPIKAIREQCKICTNFDTSYHTELKEFSLN